MSPWCDTKDASSPSAPQRLLCPWSLSLDAALFSHGRVSVILVQEEVVVYATNFAHVLFVGNLLPCMTFYLQQQVLNTRRHSLVPLIATIIGTGAQITFSLYFLRGFLAQPLNATDLPLGNESSYLGAAVSRSIGSYVMVTITGRCYTYVLFAHARRVDLVWRLRHVLTPNTF